MFNDFDVIFRYTREQAINDGVLVDVTETAKEAGFSVPVAVTRTVWDEYIKPSEEERESGQDEDGRLWDTLFMLFVEIRRASEKPELKYKVLYSGEEVELKAVISPGDYGEPVVTIMLPHED